MMKIVQFDNTNLRLVSEELKKALAPLEAQFGIKFTYRGARYSENAATLKVEAATVGDGGVVNDRRKTDFDTFCVSYGLKPEMLNKEITYAGERYSIVGLNIRSPKFVVAAKRVRDGKGFKLTADGVIGAYNREYNPNPLTQ